MPIRYSDYVDYSKLDPVKRMALELFEPTLTHLERLGIRIIPETLGEPAVAFDLSGIGDFDFFDASNVEGLGTKNLVADDMYSEKQKSRSGFFRLWTKFKSMWNMELREMLDILSRFNVNPLYRCFGQCAAAMPVNDLLSIGADAYAYMDIIACGNSNWFKDKERTRELLTGYRIAADTGLFAIPQGETPELRDVINPKSLDLAGAARGLIRPRSRLMTGNKIVAGDVIYGLSSSGIHANGLTKARRIAEKLPLGFFTELPNGKTLGEELLTPTTIYSIPVMEMFEQGIDIHYMQPITGHGWEKIARARFPFTYQILKVPEPQLVFQQLIKFGKDCGFDVSNRENYYVWNMGIGFVMIAPEKYKDRISQVANKHGLNSNVLGYVRKGDRRVVMPFAEKGKQVVYKP